MKSTTAVISFMFTVALLRSCYSRKCYECHSVINDECGEIVNDKYLIDCPKSYQCGSMVIYENGTNVIYRRCDPKGTTYTWETCSGNGCNGNGVEATTFNKSSNIKCYSCNSSPERYNSDCIQIVDDKDLRECRSNEYECTTFTAFNPDKNEETLERGCSVIGTKLISQLHCDEDKCNGQIQLVPSKNVHDINLLKLLNYRL